MARPHQKYDRVTPLPRISHLGLDHVHTSFPDHVHVAVDINVLLFRRSLQHGVNRDVGSCSSDSSALNANIRKLTLLYVAKLLFKPGSH